MTTVKESDIQRDIKTYLQYTGWFVVKTHQSMGSYKGIADLSCLKDGSHVWVEVKTPRGRLSEHQERFRDDVERTRGGYCESFNHVDLITGEVEVA